MQKNHFLLLKKFKNIESALIYYVLIFIIENNRQLQAPWH